MSNKTEEKPVVTDKPEEAPPEEEVTGDPGAFPGQNPGRLIVLPVDPTGSLDLQGYVEGRLPEESTDEEPVAG